MPGRIWYGATFTVNMVFRSLLILVLLLSATLLSESAFVREVQDELRKRHLFYGDIDGKVTPQLKGALKRYQARKGFEPTGEIDAPTAASLRVRSAVALAAAENQPPTELQAQAQPAPGTTTVVSATGVTTAGQTASASEAVSTTEAAAELLARETGQTWADLPVVPEPPAEAPTPAELTPERVNRFVETYLSDGETDDIGLQAWFYSFPVDYFNHGLVDQEFVVKDTQAYVKRWPTRKYTIVGPITFHSSGREGETLIEFTIDYTVRNGSRVKTGRTKNFWTVRAEGEDMKIIAIREEHLR